MRKRKQTFAEFMASGERGNIEFFGLKKHQIVNVKHSDYTGLARIVGEPPQGPGIYVYTMDLRKLLVGGEDIQEATEPA